MNPPGWHDPVTTTTQSVLRLDGCATCTVTLNHVSHDASVRKLHLPRAGAPPRETPRGKYWWVRWAVLSIVAIVLAVEIALGWAQLAKAWMSLYEANWWWLLASVLAAAASMHSFAQIQRTLLKSAGVHVKQLRSEAAFYAANSLSTTLPGGPVLSTTFLFRQQRLWGASTVVASWQLVMSGVLQARLIHALASWSQPSAISTASTIATTESTNHRTHQSFPRGVSPPRAGGAPRRGWNLWAGASCDTCFRVTVQVARRSSRGSEWF